MPPDSSTEIIALVDCNSFYASCEQVFRPELRGKPVVVLSNNDGCIIARNKEAKALGFEMSPYFQVRDELKKKGVHVFSSNYALYGDMSARVMKTLADFTPSLEVYSIDEAFLSFKGFKGVDLAEYAKKIQTTVQKHTGLPVSIGVGHTKVLAKAANHHAKQNARATGGVFSVVDDGVREKVLSELPAKGIWGISYRSVKKLDAFGIRTAKDFRDASPELVRKLLTVTGARLQEELKGRNCLSLETEIEDRKHVVCSRSFGKQVFELNELEEAVATYITRASERLRKQKLMCNAVQVFAHTSRFDESFFHDAATVTLLSSASSTSVLAKAALEGLRRIYKKGYAYKKAGVVLLELVRQNESQIGLFDGTGLSAASKLSEVVDRINKKMGQDAVKIAACGTHQTWAMLSQMRSPCYTTRWNNLLKI